MTDDTDFDRELELQLIDHEDIKLKPYRCSAGKLTIGVGRNLDDNGITRAEAIGQSLYYSLQTGHRAGVVLILEDQQDRVYWLRLNSTIQHFKLPIDTWAVGPGSPQ